MLLPGLQLPPTAKDLRAQEEVIESRERGLQVDSPLDLELMNVLMSRRAVLA